MNRYAARWILLPVLALVAVASVNYQFWHAEQISTDRVTLPNLLIGNTTVAASRNAAEDPLKDDEVLWRLHLSVEELASLTTIEMAYGRDGNPPPPEQWTRVPLGAQDQLQLSLPPLLLEGAKSLLIRITTSEGRQEVGQWELGPELD